MNQNVMLHYGLIRFYSYKLRTVIWFIVFQATNFNLRTIDRILHDFTIFLHLYMLLNVFMTKCEFFFFLLSFKVLLYRLHNVPTRSEHKKKN